MARKAKKSTKGSLQGGKAFLGLTILLGLIVLVFFSRFVYSKYQARSVLVAECTLSVCSTCGSQILRRCDFNIKCPECPKCPSTCAGTYRYKSGEPCVTNKGLCKDNPDCVFVREWKCGKDTVIMPEPIACVPKDSRAYPACFF